MNLLLLLSLGLSLSLDAFSLSLSYGLMNIEKSKIKLTSIIVGIFHFIMPLLGYGLSNILFKYINIDLKYFSILVFILIIFSIIKNIKEKETIYELDIMGMILFSFAVSIDSFNVGMSLNYLTNNIILAPIIFMSLSFTLTYIGFRLGNYISEKIGIISKVLSAGILIIICVYLFLH